LEAQADDRQIKCQQEFFHPPNVRFSRPVWQFHSGPKSGDGAWKNEKVL
jgi:hypothetical protein